MSGLSIQNFQERLWDKTYERKRAHLKTANTGEFGWRMGWESPAHYKFLRLLKDPHPRIMDMRAGQSKYSLGLEPKSNFNIQSLAHFRWIMCVYNII